jgi:RluA family pseudouridine synthase
MVKPKIIFEDENLLILDKPTGMTVNRSETTKEGETVQEWVESHNVIPNSKNVILNSFQDLNRTEIPKHLACRQAGVRNDNKRVQHDNLVSDFYKRSGIVHRLDKETSGILIVAKNEESFVILQQQFKNRQVQKTYVALAHGKVEPQEGSIDVPVGRLPWNRKRFGVLSEGRESTTFYKVITNYKLLITNYDEALSLLELSPKTGRTHQIRVHLQYIHHPVFADPLYAGRKTSRKDRQVLPRIFLHASKISFKDPKDDKMVTFESPLPVELENFLETLG